MNTSQLKSLSAVLDMYLLEEAKHWQEAGRPHAHIYLDLHTLSLYEKARMLELTASQPNA